VTVKTTKRRAAPAAINTPTPEPTIPERIRDIANYMLMRAAATGPDLELGGHGLTLAMVANDAEQQLAALAFQRDLAAAHDRQPYPTSWAYEQACKALRKHHDRIAAVRALHHEWAGAAPGCCAHCQDGQGTPLPYPCPTIQALDGAQGSES
jgi:hypothetical protein